MIAFSLLLSYLSWQVVILNESSWWLSHNQREIVVWRVYSTPKTLSWLSTRIQIGQIRFAMNNFNQTPSHPRGGRKELVGVNNSRPVVNQGRRVRPALSRFTKRKVLCFNILFPAETNTFKREYWNNISNIEHGERSEVIYRTLSFCLLFCDVIKIVIQEIL